MKIDIQNFLFNENLKSPEFISKDKEINANNFDLNQNSFKNILNSSQTTASHNIVQGLLVELEKQEKMILRNPSISNIASYKKVVQSLVASLSANFKSESISFHSNSGYKKVINISEVIDEKLNLIMSDFLENNKLTFESVNTFSDIKGLILDLIS